MSESESQAPLPPEDYAPVEPVSQPSAHYHMPYPPPYDPRQARHSRRTGWWVLLIVLGVCALGALLFGAVVGQLALHGGGMRDIEAVEVERGDGADAVAIITLAGVVDGVGSYAAGSGVVDELSRELRHAAEDPHVRAVVLQIDSPGGGVAASDTLNREVIRLKKSGKKVVVYVSGLAASGGYYIAAPADWIVCARTALVGSIGVISVHVGVKDLMGKIGVQVEPIKSSAMKDVGSPFREMTPEERTYLQGIIDHFYQQFVAVVAEERKLDADKVRAFGNGKIYTAEEALNLNMVDEIGYFDEAAAKAARLAGISGTPRLLRYRIQPGLMELLGARARASEFDEARQLLKMLRYRSGPEFQALWTGALPE